MTVQTFNQFHSSKPLIVQKLNARCVKIAQNMPLIKEINLACQFRSTLLQWKFRLIFQLSEPGNFYRILHKPDEEIITNNVNKCHNGILSYMHKSNWRPFSSYCSYIPRKQQTRQCTLVLLCKHSNARYTCTNYSNQQRQLWTSFLSTEHVQQYHKTTTFWGNAASLALQTKLSSVVTFITITNSIHLGI